MVEASGQITLAILAGGKSTRLGGRDKAKIKVDGIPLAQRIINQFRNLTNEILLISNNDDHKVFGVSVFPDIIKNCGPLGGIHSALTHARYPAVFIVSVDMPFVSLSIFSRLVENYFETRADIVVPKHGEYLEPLFGIYSKALVPKISKILSDGIGHPITELLNQSQTSYLALSDDFKTAMSFYNINTPDDLNALEL